MTELKQKLDKEMTNNATAINGLGISLTHLSYLKKAAGIPKGHQWPLHLLTEFLTANPDAKACGVAKSIAEGNTAIQTRIGHSKKHRPTRNPKVKQGKRSDTPNRVSVTYRLREDVYHKIQATSEVTKESATKIIEALVNEFCEGLAAANKENQLQAARIQTAEAQRALDLAQAKLAECTADFAPPSGDPDTHAIATQQDVEAFLNSTIKA